jgi:hypothetical protein
MAITSTELEQDFLRSLENTTGKSILEWMNVLGQSGCQSRQDLLEFLNNEHGWKYLPAQLLVGIFLNDGNRVYDNPRVPGPDTV